MRLLWARLVWKLQGKRNVRLQLMNNAGAIDGILVGIHAGHYQVQSAFFYEHKPNAEGNPMIGTTWVPKERVFLLNVKD
jgi:hypothetical protein